MDADPRDQIIEELEAKNKTLEAEVNRLRDLIKKLQDRVEELERQNARQAAPFRRPDKDRKPQDQHRRPGRPEGHPPAYRRVPDHVDEHIEVPLSQCPCCGGPVTLVEPCEPYSEEIPHVRPHVTHLITCSGQCVRCGSVRSTHPLQKSDAGGAAKVQLEPRASPLAAWLNKHLGLTLSKTCRVLEALWGLKVTRGGLALAFHRLAEKAEASYETLFEDIRSEPSVHADETSWWLGGRASWLWVFTTPRTTIDRVDASRGKGVVLETLGTEFKGVLGSDCLSSYEDLPYVMQTCDAHHGKAIASARQRKGLDQRGYFDQLKGLLQAARMLGSLRTDIPPPDAARARQHLEEQADALILPHRSDPDEGRVANRLRKRRQWLFTFLDYPGVEATNNRAERALRPAVITRKLSCGNKTERGKHTWEILASLAATWHQRGLDFAEQLRPLLALDTVIAAR